MTVARDGAVAHDSGVFNLGVAWELVGSAAWKG
jgi:hypothetical protein